MNDEHGGWHVLRRIRLNGDYYDSLNKFLGADWIKVREPGQSD